MTTQTTTRRQLLRVGTSVAAYAAGAAIVTGGIAIAGEAKSATGIRNELARLIANADRIAAASNDHHAKTWLPLQQRVEAAIAAIPHTTIDAGPSMGGDRVTWSTDRPSSVNVTRVIVKMGREGKDMAEAGLVEARRFQAAHLRRERAVSRIIRDSGIDAESERGDALAQASSEAQSEVGNFPVTNAADLRAKLAFMIEHEMGDGVDWLPELLEDAERLQAQGARA